MRKPLLAALSATLVALALLGFLSLLSGCEDPTKDPACGPFYAGQAVRAKGSSLTGVVADVFPFSGNAWVYMQGLPYRVTMFCVDLEPAIPRGVE